LLTAFAFFTAFTLFAGQAVPSGYTVYTISAIEPWLTSRAGSSICTVASISSVGPVISIVAIFAISAWSC